MRLRKRGHELLVDEGLIADQWGKWRRHDEAHVGVARQNRMLLLVRRPEEELNVHLRMSLLEQSHRAVRQRPERTWVRDAQALPPRRITSRASELVDLAQEPLRLGHEHVAGMCDSEHASAPMDERDTEFVLDLP